MENSIFTNKKSPNHKLSVNVQCDNTQVNDVLCEVYLPERSTDKIELLFYPNEEQFDPMFRSSYFSVYGEANGFSGKKEKTIISEKVYTIKCHNKQWASGIDETVLIGSPNDLKVIHWFENDNDNLKSKIIGHFWITHSPLIAPDKAIEYKYTGDVTVKTVRMIKHTLPNGISLSFDKYYSHTEDEKNNRIVCSELVVAFECEEKKFHVKDIFDYLNDLLLFVSFAARERCMCVGWEATTSSNVTKFYRRGITIPDNQEKHENYEERKVLIGLSDIENFTKVAFENFIKIQNKDFLRQAINRALRRKNDTVENSFLRMFSALETTLLFFKQNDFKDEILNSSDWQGFKKDIEKFIKKHPTLSKTEHKKDRGLIYEKIPELNRVAFSTAFKAFCSQYKIDLSDLWPVSDKSKGTPLSEIRNKLIHGDTFENHQFKSLSIASWHLRWTLERIILTVLGWPIADSHTSNNFLSTRADKIYKNWEKYREILSL